MSQRALLLLVEGQDDRAIVRSLFEAAQYPEDRVHVMVTGGKAHLRSMLGSIAPDEASRYAVLVDLEETGVADAAERAREQLHHPAVEVFCAVPEIEAWLFADDRAAALHARSEDAGLLLKHMPLPDAIQKPRRLAREVFGGGHEKWAFLSGIDVEYAAARSPSLRAFLVGIGRLIGMEKESIVESVGRSMSRDALAGLISEIVPSDTVMWRTTSGEYTAGELPAAYRVWHRDRTEIRDGPAPHLAGPADAEGGAQGGDVIVFVPAYDEPTRANLAVARDLPRPADDGAGDRWPRGADRSLLDAHATRANLLNMLGGDPDPLFAMAHGRPDCLLAQDHAEALLAGDAPALARRPVFAFACHTAAQLGRDMARQGVTWWGYVFEVSAPDERDLLRPLFVDVFAYLQGAFAGAGSPAARLHVLARTKDLCDHPAGARGTCWRRPTTPST